MALPDRREYRDIPTLGSWSDFDSVSAVKSALRELEGGMFTRAAGLVDAMGRDDRVSGVMSTRVQSLLGSPRMFRPRKDSARGRRVASELEVQWPSMFANAGLSELFRWGHWLGVGLGELVWRRAARRWTPQLKVWHPQYMYWRWDTRSYWVSTMDGQVEVTPGDGKWVVYAPHGLQRGWMGGLVRSLAVLWLIRQWALRDWARYSEVHGLPARKAIVPNEADQETKDRFFDDVRSLGVESTLLLEQDTATGRGFDLELLEAQANTYEGIKELISQADASIAITVLGQNLTTEVRGHGSQAAARTHEKTKQDLLEADAATLSETLLEQVLKPWARFNLGDEQLAPYPRFDTDPPGDKKAAADALVSLGAALQAFRDAGVDDLDVGALLDGAGVPRKRAAARAPTAAPEANGAKGPDEQGHEAGATET